MNLWFGKENQETIKRIQELCEEKGYRFIFGVRSYGGDDLDSDIIDHLKGEGIIMKDYDDEYNSFENTSSFWLELHKDDKMVRHMVYTVTEYKVWGSGVCNSEYNTDCYGDTKTNIQTDFDTNDQEVHLKYPYRRGVVLGSFANHTAKFLGEPDKMKGIVY